MPDTDPAATDASAAAPEDFQAVMDGWKREIVPLLEKHAERRFRRPPVVEVFDPKAYESFLKREATLVMAVTLKDTPIHVRERVAEEEGGLISVFGKYGLFDQKTYLVPEAITMAANRAGREPANLARIVLAHELAHALQHEYTDATAQFEELVDLDHMRCWSSVSEGGANLLALAVARDLGIEEDFWVLSSNQGWGPDGLIEPRAYPVWMSYGRGMETLEEVVASEGMDGFWKWTEHPPASSSMLFRPATYDPTPVPEPPLAQVLRGTEQLLTQGDWLVSNSRLGEYELRGAAIRTGKVEAFEPVLAELQQAQHLDLRMQDGRTGDIAVLRFATPEAAEAYVKLLRAEQTIEGQYLAKQLGRTVEVTYTDVAGVEGDSSLLRTQRIPMGGGTYLETRTAWVARGSDIVMVEAERFRPGLRLAATLNGVFERLAQP